MKRLLGCTLPALLTTLALTGCGSSDGEPKGGGGEANLKLPPLNEQVGNVSGTALLWIGLVICLFGLVFGLVTYSKLQKLPVHEAMHEVSELIYETCKTYLKQQAKFLMLLWAFIAAVIVVYFLFLEHMGAKVLIILLFSLIGMVRSRLVRHSRQHLCQFPYCPRLAAWLPMGNLRHPDAFRHEHRHGPHQRRADPHALHHAGAAR